MSTPQVVVSGSFDDIRSRHLRLLEEAAKLGELTVLVWPDKVIQKATGRPPKLPLAERRYFLNAVRYVARVLPGADLDAIPALGGVRPRVWVTEEADANDARREFCRRHKIEYALLSAARLAGFPEPPPMPSAPGRKKVIVTGCYDWFHSGHVRFFEEVSAYGDLYAIVGHDENIRLLKGEGHPLFPQEERRYMAGSIKYVKQALISTGHGWLDAEPEILRLKPDIYAVNEDGDRGGKRDYCQKLGIEYLVLNRTPAPGLQPRRSTDLRGF
jgi:cytidyltransferase-like protein